MRKRRWSDNDLIDAVSKCTSIAEVLGRLGLRAVGGNYRSIGIHIRRLGLIAPNGTKHPRVGRGKGNGRPRVDMSDILSNQVIFAGSKLRGRLIKEGYLENFCSMCGIGPDWCKKPLTLHLDHIDGNRYNNSLNNLRIVCPNCHSQTKTYCGRNKKYAGVDQ